MHEHPGGAESVAEHREPGRKERVLHGHEDLTAIRQQREYPIRFLIAVKREGQIGAANRLKPVARDVGARQLGPSETDARVEDLAHPLRRPGALAARLLAVAHHHRDLAAKALLVELERFLTVAAVV